MGQFDRKHYHKKMKVLMLLACFGACSAQYGGFYSSGGNSGFSNGGSSFSSRGNSGFSSSGGNSGYSSGGNDFNRVTSLRFGNIGGGSHGSGFSSGDFGFLRSSGGNSGYSSGSFSGPHSSSSRIIFASNNRDSGFSSGGSGHGRIISVGGGSGRSRSYYNY